MSHPSDTFKTWPKAQLVSTYIRSIREEAEPISLLSLLVAAGFSLFRPAPYPLSSLCENHNTYQITTQNVADQ